MKQKPIFMLLFLVSSGISITPMVQSATFPNSPEQTFQHRNFSPEILLVRPPICPEEKPCYPPPRSPNEIQIFSPIQGSFLFNNYPSTIAWSAIPGASRYSVSIEHAGEVLWDTIVTNQTEIPYPSEVFLEVGKDYTLIVRTDSNRELGSLNFRQLSEHKTQSIQEEANSIKNSSSVIDSEKALKLAEFYSSHTLFNAAINVLLNAYRYQSDSVSFSQEIGNLYWQVRQPILAKSYYEQALHLAISSNSLSEQADAKVGLGLVDMAQLNWEEAIQWLQQARSHYQQLNQHSLATEIARLLAEVFERSGDRQQAIYWSEKAETESRSDRK